jgi:RHS repeat-associated protein
VYYIYLNGKQIAKVEGGQKSFYHTDHLGSTRAITDDLGKVTGRFEYQPFGLEENTVAGDDTLTFTGKMQDAPTGLMYFNARYYDPTLGRFITEDPAKQGTNWYIYCYNSPLRYVDFNGKTAVEIAETNQGHIIVATINSYVLRGRSMVSKTACERWEDYVLDVTKFEPSSAVIKYGFDTGITVLGIFLSSGPLVGIGAVKGLIDLKNDIESGVHNDNLKKIDKKLDKGFTLTRECGVVQVLTLGLSGYQVISSEIVTNYYITISSTKGYENIAITEGEYMLLLEGSKGEGMQIL